MGKYIFKGQVIPDRAKLTVNAPPQIQWDAPECDFSMILSLSITEGAIEVTCDTNKESAPHMMSQMHMRALDIARTAINLVAFEGGYGLSIVMDTVIEPNGNERKLLMREAPAEGTVTAFEYAGRNYGKILSIIFAEPAWFLALNDLIESLSVPHTAARNCGRAIETIRSLVANGDGTDTASEWSRMRTELNFTTNYLKFVTDHSKAPRHGSAAFVAYETVSEIRSRAWVVMNRFMEYRLRGNEKLPLDEFPTL